MLKINFNKVNIFLFLFPFLFGRGFFETSPKLYSFFKYIMLAVLIVYSIFSFSYFLRYNKKIPNTVFYVIGYYILFVLITLLKQKGLDEGIQKLFYAPLFFFVSFYFLKYNFKNFINIASDIMLIMLALNVTIFNTYFYKGFDNYFHITFLGHVQIISQVCVVAILLSFILFKILNKKNKSIVLFLFAILNLLYSGTTASYIVLLIGLFLILFKGVRSLINTKFIFLSFFIINLCLFLYAMYGKAIYSGNSLLTLSGRTEIWLKGYEMFFDSWLLGYGAYGVNIVPFWEIGKDGFNYAHNDLLQHLLDGGIVLSLIFYIIIYKQLNQLSFIKDEKVKNVMYSITFLFFIIMLVESSTEYYYYFILFFNIIYVSHAYINEIGEKCDVKFIKKKDC